MRIRLATCTAALLLLPWLSTRAEATPFIDLATFTAAAGPLTLIDFNAATSGDIGGTYAALGVTFSPGNHFAPCLTFTTSPPGCWVSDSGGGALPGVFEASFSVAGITAVGMNNALNADLAQLRVFDSSDNLIEMVSSDTINNTMDFFGVITTTPIARITVQYVGAVDGWAVDDLRFGTGVPEPSSILLIGVGVAGLFRSVRRRGMPL
jgi:hypothetical protein